MCRSGEPGYRDIPQDSALPRGRECRHRRLLLANADNYPVNIPVHQGIFVHDAQTGTTHPIAKNPVRMESSISCTGCSRDGLPGTGGGDEPAEEPPRWRSSAFAALSATPESAVQTAFKANKSTLDGIYLRQGLSETLRLLP